MLKNYFGKNESHFYKSDMMQASEIQCTFVIESHFLVINEPKSKYKYAY